MEIRLTRSFERDYRELPNIIKKAVDKKLLLLLDNFRHSSLQVKKMEGYKNVWEARINQGFLFTFSIFDKTYVIRRVGKHDILKKP